MTVLQGRWLPGQLSVAHPGSSHRPHALLAPRAPRREHVYGNKAMSGTSSAVFAPCLQQLVPQVRTSLRVGAERATKCRTPVR